MKQIEEPLFVATGLQAERAIAEASGVPLVTVSQIARELRMAGDDLWLRTGSGRRIAHASKRHLVNLSLGAALGPPSKAVANVTMFRSLSTAGVREQLWNEDSTYAWGAIVDGHRLGEYLENFISAIVKGELDEDAGRLRKQFSLVLTPMHWDARVIWRGRQHKDFDHIHTFRNLIELPDCPTAEDWAKVPPAPQIGTTFETSTTLRYPFFEALAGLLHDSEQRSDSDPLPSPSELPSPASDGPEGKNAAPARAASRRPRVTAADALEERRHPIPVKEQGQGTRGRHHGDPDDPADPASN